MLNLKQLKLSMQQTKTLNSRSDQNIATTMSEEDNNSLTKSDLPEFAQRVHMQVKMNNDKLKRKEGYIYGGKPEKPFKGFRKPEKAKKIFAKLEKEVGDKTENAIFRLRTTGVYIWGNRKTLLKICKRWKCYGKLQNRQKTVKNGVNRKLKKAIESRKKQNVPEENKKESPDNTPSPELNKTALNDQLMHNNTVLEKVTNARQLLQDMKDIESADILLGQAIALIKDKNEQLITADNTVGANSPTVKAIDQARLFDEYAEEAKLMRQMQKAAAERYNNRQARYRIQRPFQEFQSSSPGPYDVCRFCGALGHWQRNCPQLDGGYLKPVCNQPTPNIPEITPVVNQLAKIPAIPAVHQPNCLAP